jgi:hypothetical protein
MTCLLALIVAGCGSSTSVVVPKSPHGGTLFTAIEGTQVVEIVRQDGSPGKVQFTAYFLDDQLKPLTPAPTAVTFQPKAPRGAPRAELKPTGDADPKNASSFASPAIDDDGGIVGELAATIDGKPVLFTINAR